MHKLRYLTILASFLTPTSLLAAYPNHGLMPSAMVDTSLFPYKSFFQQENFNTDGTLKSNPVISAGTRQQGGTLYVMKKLSSQDAIQFPDKNGKNYVVYSAIPQEMTIDYAYQHTAQYYDSAQLNSHQLDFPNTPPAQLNDGHPSSVTLTDSVVPGSVANQDKVFLAQTNYYIPNLPNTQEHNGSTANIYWTVDPWFGQNNSSPHLIPYGWAYDSAAVNQSLIWNNLKTGGSDKGTTTIKQESVFNYWRHVIDMGKDPALTNAVFTAMQNNADYPFPKPQNADNLWQSKGAYLPVQPMPGFQQNLIRWYTPWGAWNLLNNTSGLFVRNDGSVELPAYQNNGNWTPYPLVTQTWDGTQRFTVLNLSDGVVPSTYDQYPGSEYYFAANTYLPDTAGVLTAYQDYAIFDDTGTLNPRQTDIWFGMKGDSAADIMRWDDANGKEPGGQANKPYMAGADMSHRAITAQRPQGILYYTARVQHANSFFLAPSAKKPEKMYATSLCMDSGQGYQLVGTLSYQWKPWTIVADGNTPKWATSTDGSGMWVPTLKASSALKNFISASRGTNFVDSTHKAIIWQGAPYSGQQNGIDTPDKAVYFYTLAASTDQSNVKFLAVLTNTQDDPSQDAAVCK